jgi:hypothetical protein
VNEEEEELALIEEEKKDGNSQNPTVKEPKLTKDELNARLAVDQLEELSCISKEIWNSSKKFDIDFSSNSVDSRLDVMIEENVIKKILENDDLIIIEGMFDEEYDFVDRDELYEDIQEENENDAISAGDFEEEFEYKKTLISGKFIPKKGFFENN